MHHIESSCLWVRIWVPGRQMITAFQMLNPSLTRDTQKLGMYCLIMFVNALYSASDK